MNEIKTLSGQVSALHNLNGSISPSIHLNGSLSSTGGFNGKLSNATLRGIPVELRVTATTLQWKYEDENSWHDLMDLNEIDYEKLNNLPTVNGDLIIKEVSGKFITPKDALTNMEIENLLRNN